MPFQLPEGITIDLAADQKRGEDIFRRVHKYINKVYEVWCGHPMDPDCGNINRMTGLAHDPQAVYRPDAYPFMLTREDLGIDEEGNLIKLKTPKYATDKSGNRISVHLGNNLERAGKMLEEAGVAFVKGNRHNYVMRLGFILNRMGVDEEEAAQAVDDAYLGQMDERPSSVIHSCYKTASDEFGAYMSKRSNSDIKVELIANFLKEKPLRHDVLSQKTQSLQEDGRWVEMTEREENDLYMECCSQTGENLSQKMFQTVLNSSVVPEVHPLREYLSSLPAWSPEGHDYIAEAAAMVHMETPESDALWQCCFKKWFVAMVASWKDDDVSNHQVIVLAGQQGIYKSTWIRSLMPPQLKAYVCDQKEMEKLDKDEQLRAAEYALINLDEIDTLSERGLNTLKAQITTPHVDVRASYGHHKVKRVRVATYAASGNKLEFLTDQTGNRRWLPFHVISIDSPFEHQMPYEGMYSQALYLVNNGFNYWFDLEEIKNLKGHVEEFMVQSSEEQLLLLHYSPIEPGEPRAAFKTVAEIAADITIKGNLRKAVDSRQLGAIMKKHGFKAGRCGKARIRGYYVMEHTENDIDLVRSTKDL